jgi:hypothetical protein
MTEVDQEKMIKLAEGIEYENEESYTEKLQIIKDKYFRTEDAEEKQVLSEDTQDDMEPNEDNSSDDVMAEAPENIKQYATAISRTIIK